MKILSITLFMLIMLVSCSKELLFEQLVQSQAAKSDVIWLCTVELNSENVRYRTKTPLKTKAVERHFKQGELLPESGPIIESGTQYGNEAIVFLIFNDTENRYSSRLTLIIHDGLLDNGMSREEIIKLIQNS